MYMSDMSAFVLIAIYLPICLVLLWLLNYLLRKLSVSLFLRKSLLVSLSVMMFLYATWDAVLGKYYLDQFCKNEGGVYINSNVRVSGIYLNSIGEVRHAKYFLDKGYEFVEMDKNKNRGGHYIFYQLQRGGKIEGRVVPVLKSKYTRGFVNPNTKVGPDYLEISLSEQFIEHIGTGKRIAGFRNYRMTTRLDRKLRGIGGNVATSCTDILKFRKLEKYEDYSRYHELVTKPTTGRKLP